MTDPQMPPTPTRPSQRPAVLIAAFEGWNDAGSAASAAVAAVAQAWNATKVATLDPEQYHDFQVNRPVSSRVDGVRHLEWPETTVSTATTPSGMEVVFVQGVEPSVRWRTYCEELLTIADGLRVGTIVSAGALLADTPHTRPIPVQRTSDDPVLQSEFEIEASDYEGPAGIVGVLSDLATAHGIPTLSIWAAVPHYVAQAPSPKATLALVNSLEETLGETVSTELLMEEAQAWQLGVNELAEEDPEISDYVRQLEETRDTSELPEASGEAIAREFERYLRRRDGSN